MKYPGLIAALGSLCKQAGIGPIYDKPRPTETPAQAKRAIGKGNNFSTGGVFQQAAPQGQPQVSPQTPQAAPQSGRLPQIRPIE